MLRPPIASFHIMTADLGYENDHVRRILDEELTQLKGTTHEGCVRTPREDARKFRTPEEMATNCECIVEMYELLWRWGNLDRKNRNFYRRFGFVIPHSVVIVRGRPYAWYFMSKKDGALLRKRQDRLTTGFVERCFCKEDRKEGDIDVAAVWIPMSSQFTEDRCMESPCAEFLSCDGTRAFMQNMGQNHSGVLQQFVAPQGISNCMIRAVQFQEKVSIAVRQNRFLLSQQSVNIFKRCATFEGWPGLSGVMYRYNNPKHPEMQERLLEVARRLTLRIKQERVRQMHFLAPNQYVALHFKVTPDSVPHFVFASIVPEREVVIQTKYQLLLEDTCMTESLPGAMLIPGGTNRKMEVPGPEERRMKAIADREAREREEMLMREEMAEQERTLANQLPPLRLLSGQARQDRDLFRGPGRAQSARRSGEMTDRGREEYPGLSSPRGFIPRLDYSQPSIPPPPYVSNIMPHDHNEAGRFECAPPFAGVPIKHPLVSFRNPADLRGNDEPPQ